MFELPAEQVCAVTGAELLFGDAARILRGVVTDSREVGRGGTYVAFKGERVDGNAFAPGAIEAGAAAVVLSDEPSAELLAVAAEHGACVLRAADDDPTAFLLALAGEWRSRHSWLCVGITGSVGKTTTKDLTLAALRGSFAVHANRGNLNSVIGVPLTILSAPEETEVLVCEMGMNHPGEIAAIAGCARPRLGVVTNIGTSHIGYLGSREAIADAKAEIVAELAASEPSDVAPEVGPALVLASADDFTGYLEERYAKPAGVETLEVGEGKADALRAEDVVLDAGGHPSFTVVSGAERVSVTLSLTGSQAVIDSLFALAVAERLGVELACAAKRIARLHAASMRANLLAAPGGWTVIDDTYNASPSSLAAALDTLRDLAVPGRRIAVVGTVGELGAEARHLHGLMGAYVAAVKPDLVCFVGGEDAGTMAEAASIMGLSRERILRAKDALEAADLVVRRLLPGDVVLVKASRALGLERFSEAAMAS